MLSVHKCLDKSSRKTFEYERAANFLLELVLLVVGALPIVTGIRSGLAYGLVAALRLYETELRREDASVAGRHAERGGVLPLPSEKVTRAAQRTKTLAVVTWIWPGLAAIVQAAESKLFGVVLLVSVGTTLVRVAWGRVLMPAWRGSRLAWQNAHQSEEQFTTASKEAMEAAPVTIVIPIVHSEGSRTCLECGRCVDEPQEWEVYALYDSARVKLESIKNAVNEIEEARHVLSAMANTKTRSTISHGRGMTALYKVEKALKTIAEEAQ